MSTVKGSPSSSTQNGFSAVLANLRSNPKIPLLIAAAAAIAVVAALALWAKTPDYRVLYSNLNDRDGGAIVSQLEQLKVPYRFTDGGGALLIPADKVYETRLRLAQQGLPKGGAVGFELLDQEKFGISQFSEQVNYQRGLEGELARTIETLGPVASARVHLAIPKPSLFVRDQKSPSASVTLNLQPGRALDDGQINAIVYMVSSSVSGLPPDGVTVVDQNGRLLTQSGGDRDLNTTQLKYAAEVENLYQRRIETILAPVVGAGNVHAQVTAQLDFSSREQTDEQYQPNQEPGKAAVRSKQSSDSAQRGAGAVGGVPGALSNQPSPAPTAPINGAANNTAANTAANPQAGQQPQNAATAATPTGPSSNRNDSTINYEVDRTIRHTRQSAGSLQRLSVAVVVNYRAGDDGKPIALSDDQIKQIESLTKEAMGYSSDRGDTLNVVNTPFTQTDASGGALPFWQQDRFIYLLMNAGRWLLVALAAWLLWRKLLRPLVQKNTQLAADHAAAVAASAASPTDKDVVVKLSKDEQEQQKRSQQKVNAEERSQRIRDMAENDPRVVALVIRQWMGNEV